MGQRASRSDGGFLLLTRSRGLETDDGGSRHETRDAGGQRQERQESTERKQEKGEQREGTRDEAKAEDRRAKEVVHLYTPQPPIARPLAAPYINHDDQHHDDDHE